jgi:predicted dithiol-disulfide oxidoreductase (DUF899 family)
VSHDEWIAARTALLAKEKAFTRMRDDLGRLRRALPWEPVDKEYVFEGADGPRTLADLFDGRSQLVVYHFMFPPEWSEGCPHCSFWADSFDANVVHMNARDVSFAAISRSPQAKLAEYERRMGWSFAWLSSGRTDFNFDYGVSFTPKQQASEAVYNYAAVDAPMSDREGVSVFVRDDDGRIFHTYSAYARGIDLLNAAYNYIDLTPKGRDEEGRPPQFWVRRHDEYDHERSPEDP